MQQKSGQPPRKKKAPPPLGLVTPPRGHPFAGATGLNAPAQNTSIPALTAHVKIAEAQKQRLQQGGLLTPAQQKSEATAAKVLAKTPPKTAAPPAGAQRRTLAAASHRPPTGSQGAPIQIGAPPAPPTRQNVTIGGVKGSFAPGGDVFAPDTKKPARVVGAHPSQPVTQTASHSNLLSQALGTALSVAASVPRVLTTPIHPGATHTAIEDVKPTHLSTAITDATTRLANSSNAAATALQGAGLSLPSKIPSADIVPAAGAASQTEYTPQALVAAGMTPEQTKRFRDLAIHKRHWYPGEIDGLVGLDLLKHAYNDAPSGVLGTAQRLLQNGAAGVIRTATLPQVPVAIAKEVASGHGLRAVKEIGDVAAKQLGGIVSNPGQAFVSDPYTFVPVAGGALKTLGGVGGKVAEKAGKQAVERSVLLKTTADSTGRTVNRGPLARNLYTATGQVIADKATGMSKRLSLKAEAQDVEKLVADTNNATAPLHHAVQVGYAKAFKKVGPKRAAILLGINKAGGKPEKILAKYTADGNARQVKFWTQVVAASKNLSERDKSFLDAHNAMASGTTEANVTLGRFGDTAGIYRAHQPLILSDAHAGDPVAQRVQALHEEWINALKKTDDPATLEPLHGAYDHAVREFAQTHLDTGGIEPTRVAYTPPPATGVMTSPYTKGTGGKVRFNSRVPKQKASTGGSFESGNYLIDPKVALRENLQAQRLRTSVGLTSDESLAKIGAIKAEKGDARPDGYVFTPSQNPATVGKVITDLRDKPVGAHDYYHRESDIRDRFAKNLEAHADGTGEEAGTQGWFVPEGAWNRILDYTRPESRNGYDKFMRQYQRAMISIFPSTLLGNTVGSVPLALAAGAGPKSFGKALESSRDATLVPNSLHGRGVAGNLAADARNPLSMGMNKMRAGSVKGEDFSRDAAFFSKALRGAKKRSTELGYKDVNSYLRDMATGKVDPHVRDAAIAHAIKFAGDAAKPATKAGKIVGKVVLFPQWLQHMTKLMLVTLPLHHPRRLALINAMAAYGDQYRKENGSLPSWMQEFAPLFEHTIGKQKFTEVAGLGQLAPQGTAGGIFDTLNQSGVSVPERLINLTNPPVAGVLNTGVQAIKNKDSRYPVDIGRFALNQALYTVPGMSKFFPRTGMEPDSLPWDPRRYTVPYIDADGNKVKVPWAMRSGARPEEGALGILSRVLGTPLYNVPTADSVINKRQVGTAIYKAEHPKGS